MLFYTTNFVHDYSSYMEAVIGDGRAFSLSVYFNSKMKTASRV